jgi:hypothetical protein
VNLAVNLVARPVPTLVAGRGHDDQTGVHQTTDGQTQWVNGVGIDGGGAEAQVDDSDVVGGAVGLYPVERTEKRRDVAPALRVQDAQVDYLRRGRDAAVRAVRDLTVAGGDGGDVCAVPVGVVGATLTREVLAVGYARGAARFKRERGVVRVEPGVEHGDADACALVGRVVVGRHARGVRARRQRDVSEQLDLAVERDIFDVGAGG